MMRGSIGEFLREVREGFADFDETVDWQDWLDKAQKNVVALTIVFCFVVITGSCVAVPVIGLVRSGEDAPVSEQHSEPAGQPANNPWSLDEPRQSPEAR